MTRKKKQTYVPKWKQLLKQGWKVYNDGINNKMFPNATEAKAAGYSLEGFAPRYNSYTTHFTHSDLNRYR